jgi:predicted nucleic acid-binding protein
LVIDASATLAWCFHDEQTSKSRGLLREVVSRGAIVPPHWRFEVANGLQMAVRRQRIDIAFRDLTLADLGALDISVDSESEGQAWTTTVALADRHGLTIYDAAYLELAQRRRVSLATLDEGLVRAARASLIAVVGDRA